MNSVLPLYLTVFGIILVVIPLTMLRRDESTSRNLAKIRVPVDDRRRNRQVPEPTDEEFETRPFLVYTLVGMIMLLIVMVLSSL